MRAKDIMTTPVISVTPETPLKEVAAILIDHEITAVPVVDMGGELIGIISEADLVTLETQPDPRLHVIPPHYRHRPTPHVARDVMTREVTAVHEDADVAEVAKLMLHHRLKTVPVVIGKDLIGIISRRDILKVLARSDSDIHVEIEDLLDDELLMMGRFRAEVEDGVVTLHGPGDAGGRRLAELLARSVPGVIDVRFAEDPARTSQTAPSVRTPS